MVEIMSDFTDKQGCTMMGVRLVNPKFSPLRTYTHGTERISLSLA